MKPCMWGKYGGKPALVAAVILSTTTLVDFTAVKAATDEQFLYVEISDLTRPPIGWIEFSATHSAECATTPTTPRDVVLTPKAFNDLVRVNKWVNEAIKPMTDLEHWGVIEKWSYPDDGYGDCEDYGWPREALLITAVRDKKDEGHAVLTVKTDRGEFILDNQADDVLPWSGTGYRFVKRQSQHDPNVWVAIGDPRPALLTAAASKQRR